MARRRVLRSTTTALLVLLALFATSRPVSAECPFIPPFPRAEPAIRSADEVIVGELIRASAADLDLGPNQGPREFAMRVTEVLRGRHAAGDLLDVQYLQPNWPWIMFRGGSGEAFPSCTYLLHEARAGETIVLALGAVQPRQRLETDGLTWIQPRTVYNAMSKIRDPGRLAEIRRLAGLPQTDMAPPVASEPAPRILLPWVVIIAAGTLAGAAGWFRAGRRLE
jgi:hypothetical protein